MNVPKRQQGIGLLIGFLILMCAVALGQQQQGQKKQDDIPDAPSATKPDEPPPLPAAPVPAPSEFPAQPTENVPPIPKTEPPRTSDIPPSEPEPDYPKPPINIKTVPEGTATKEEPEQNLDPVFTVNVNQVIIPVRVTDDSGRMTPGLVAKDFQVFENGVQQKMNFFTSDPFALSVAVIIDLGMPDSALQKVNRTFAALQGAFSQFDEVSVYTYSSAVGEVSDFGSAGRRLGAVLDDLKTVRGHNDGVPVMGGPLGPQGPTINGTPADPSAPLVRTPPKESHVLNDAVLKAAFDLSRRDKSRRKIIFIISDGREYRSRASYRDVLRVLLTNNIMVYGIGTGSNALPGVGTVSRLHIPLMGYSNILPKYAAATGGEVVDEYSRSAIDDAYATVLGDARNQYTLGYLTHPGNASTYRQIEVRVDRPDCSTYASPCVKTYAKAGYYSLPQAHPAQ
jgi:VWFA-related protein